MRFSHLLMSLFLIPSLLWASVLERETAAQTHPSGSFESGFGLLTLTGPGVAVHLQGRFRFRPHSRYFWGVDTQFALFPAGNLLSVLPGVWWESQIFSFPWAFFVLGGTGGPAFATGMPGVSSASLALGGEVSLVFEIDDLASVRGQVRPGIVGGKFALGVGILIGFGFR